MADAVILAGGAGTRLWPLSRSSTPKHLLKLVPTGPGGERQTLLRATYERVKPIADRVIVVTDAEQLELARAEIPELGDDGWIAEPGRRGTAACLALAVAGLAPDGVMISVHADHIIPDAAAFRRTAGDALAWAAASGSLVTVGVTPTEPATGFGYIQRGEQLFAEERAPAFRAVRFVEKPPLAQAQHMVESGDYVWNTGLFAWRNDVFLEQVRRHAPEIAAAVDAAAAARRAGDLAAFARLYAAVPEMAVDNAVMERTADLLVVEAAFAWSDVGSWADLGSVLPLDAEGNAVLGDALLLGARDNVVVAGGRRLIGLFGVSDLVVVETEDALLVCPRDRAQEVKALVAELRRRGREDLL